MAHAALNERLAQRYRVMEERAADAHYQQVPGGNTGVLTRRALIVGSGEKARIVWEYVLDGVLLREIRALERQAAQELAPLQKTPFSNEKELNAEIKRHPAQRRRTDPDTESE